LKEKLSSYRISDQETIETIGNVYRDDHYMLDPHGAVGYLALQHYLQENPDKKGLFLETAHPVKFPEAVERITNEKIPVPPAIAGIMDREKHSLKIQPVYNQLKEYLLGK